MSAVFPLSPEKSAYLSMTSMRAGIDGPPLLSKVSQLRPAACPVARHQAFIADLGGGPLAMNAIARRNSAGAQDQLRGGRIV